MTYQHTAPTQVVVPMIDYADGVVALEWLSQAFGFVERTRLIEEGRLTHGELEAFGGLIMIGQVNDAYEGPKSHREHCEQSARWQDTPYIVDGVLVCVPDVEAHRAIAEKAGARILSGIEESPYGLLYRAEDLEGHRWMFLQPPAA
jgi:uncharacterized glyoxalase superfamily protein PhnB